MSRLRGLKEDGSGPPSRLASAPIPRSWTILKRLDFKERLMMRASNNQVGRRASEPQVRSLQLKVPRISIRLKGV